MINNLYDDLDYTLINQNEIAERIAEIAQQIEGDYQHAEGLILVCLLKGSLMFAADLSRSIKRHHEIDFMIASSYGGATVNRNAVEILHDVQSDIFGRHVLIIEDIVDSGYTLAQVRQMLLDRHPASIRICSLLDKPDRREINVQIDYVGFEIPDEFVVGYGLDYGEKYRNLPFVAVLKETIFTDNLD